LFRIFAYALQLGEKKMKILNKAIKYKIFLIKVILLIYFTAGCTNVIQKVIPGPAEFPVRVVSLQELPDGYYWEYGLTDQRGIFYNHICYPDAHYIGDSVQHYHINIYEDLVLNN
jgi:hypothetical protein